VKKIGIVLITHGSLSQNYVKQVNDIAREVERKLREYLKDIYIEVVTSYLHHQNPKPEEAIRILIDKKFENIIVFSLFVVEGIHGREDTMKIVEKFENIKYAGTLWPDSRVIDIIVDKILRCIT